LKWQNIDADDLPAQVKKSFDAMVEAEAAFKADLEGDRHDHGDRERWVGTPSGRRYSVRVA
jgi:hypothetical protein